MRLTPDQPRAHLQLGTFYSRQGCVSMTPSPPGARACTRTRSIPSCIINLGWRSSASPANPRQLNHFKLAAQFKPEWPEAQEQFGLSLLAYRRWAEACDHFALAVQLQPRDASFHYNYAVALGGVGATADAASEYRQALQLRYPIIPSSA